MSYEIPGVDSKLLEILDDKTLEFLQGFYNFKREMFLNIRIRNPKKNTTDLILTNEIAKVPGGRIYLENIDSFGTDTKNYKFKLMASNVVFQKIVELKTINGNFGKIAMSLVSSDYYECVVAKIIYNLMEYFDEN